MGWDTVKLKECCCFENGDRGKNYPGRKAFVSSGVPFINAGHLSEGEIDWANMNFISRERYDRLSNGKIRKGDVLFCLRGSLGKFASVSNNTIGAIASSLVIVRPQQNSILTEYLAYYFRSSFCTAEIDTFSNGAAQPNLSAKSLGEFQIPLPPLAEQERIVAILDEVFAGLQTATANTEKNLANARELFGSYLNNIFTQKDEGWEEKRLGDVCSLVSTGPFGSLLHKSDYVSEGVPLVNPINISADSIIPDPNKLIDERTKRRLSSYILEKDDIVIARRGEIGRCACVTKEQSGWVCGTGCFFLRPLDHIVSRFMAHLIRSAPYRSRLEASSTGATMKNISNKTLQSLKIAYPARELQENLLGKIDGISDSQKEIEAIAERKLAALAELKQSILQKAFSGALTANPDRALAEAGA